MMALRCVLLLCCAVYAPGALAIDVVIGGTTIVVPEPPGYLDAARVSATLAQFGQTLAPQSNRMLGYLVQREDQQRMASGEEPKLERYHLIEVQRTLEAQTITRKEFEQARAAIRAEVPRGFSRVRGTVDQEFRQRGQEMGKVIGDPTLSLKLGQTSGLGLFEDRDTAIGFLTSVSFRRVIKGEETTIPVVVATTITLVRGRALFLYTYFLHNSDADVDAARQTALAWLAAVEKANGRPAK